MSRSLQLSLATALLVGSASVALGQVTVVAEGTPRGTIDRGTVERTVTPCCLSRLTAEEAAMITADIERARTFAVEGRMSEARRLLRDVIDRQERADAYAGASLRMLANAEYGLNRPIVAAGILMRLADEAAAAGDPATELEALLDAGVLYAQAGRVAAAKELRPRVRTLLNSPAIPEARRQAIAARISPE